MTPPTRSTDWWRARVPRERVMLALMAVLVAGFAWWYGLLWPLRALRDGAGARYDQAVSASRTAEAEVAALSVNRNGAARVAMLEGEALQRHVLDSARAAGLAPSRQRSAADGAFVLEFERVASPALFAWLGTLADDGLAPSSLRVEPAEGRLRADVGFGGRAP
ncbi:type II secretion system protein GspM [Luteimonas kalidii]|uniref:Type II secretion system protein GspM n=1 Tax=Luteimonas kalidii TaxID=3042025 RepID=A0ABT6JQI9_9GAMM|nr:type II secretion system protein GspM [Luteimonas kalidii]MDH5832874.1 type II secretion system protein GspM [Luteimonas kalidii]